MNLMKLAAGCFLVLFCLAGTVAAEDQQIRVAVMDFKSDGNEGATISEVVRNELIRTGSFILAERDAMEKVVKEQQIQMSGLIDTDDAVEIGKMTAAKKLIMGSIGSIGDQIIITVRVVDVESGAVEIGDKQIAYSRNEIVSVIEDLTRKIASKIIGREIQVSGKSYFASSQSFSEMKVLYTSGRNVTISAGLDLDLRIGQKLVVYIVKASGQEQRKAVIEVRKTGADQAECRESKKLDGMITSTDLVRKVKPGETFEAKRRDVQDMLGDYF